MSETLSQKILSAAMEVHTLLGGPGLLESVYESALYHELTLRGLCCQRQVSIPVVYKGKEIRKPFFLDLLVEKQIVIEVKALEIDTPYYRAQLFTHMRLLNLPYGLLINFGKERLKDGILPVVNEMAKKAAM